MKKLILPTIKIVARNQEIFLKLTCVIGTLITEIKLEVNYGSNVSSISSINETLCINFISIIIEILMNDSLNARYKKEYFTDVKR